MVGIFSTSVSFALCAISNPAVNIEYVVVWLLKNVGRF